MPMSKTAGGNIDPNTIVKLDTSNDGQVLAAGAGDKPYGICYGATRYAPWSALDDGHAAISGENVEVFTFGDKGVMLRLGGTVSPGDLIKPDASGFGIATTSDHDIYCAIAQMAGVSGQLIAVDMVFGETSQ